MNLDELKEKWAGYDRKLDTVIRLNETRIRKLETRRSLQRLFWFGLGDMAVNGMAAMLLGTFIAGHLKEPEFWLPAAILYVGVILQLAFAVRQWLELKAVDYSGPILLIQKRLAGLRLLRVRIVKWTLLVSPLLWTPLLIVLLKGLLDINAYQAFPANYLLANLAFGAAFLGLMVWMARHFADRLNRSPRLEQLMDHLAGRTLTDALAGLREIADFAQEQKAV